MNQILRSIGIFALAVVTVAAPVSAFTDAHPHLHNYYGPGAAEVSADGLQASFDSITCADVMPIFAGSSIVPPPSVTRDGDMETGIGGSCFQFTTIYGSDADEIVTVWVQENVPFARPTWTACVDVDGDGVCLDGSVDQVNRCTVGLFAAGSIDLDGSGTCDIWLDPAAADPTLYVIMDVDADTRSGLGTVWLE